jgi:hypothetical protein
MALLGPARGSAQLVAWPSAWLGLAAGPEVHALARDSAVHPRARPALGLPPACAADRRVPLVSETETGGKRPTVELTDG